MFAAWTIHDDALTLSYPASRVAIRPSSPNGISARSSPTAYAPT